MPNFVLKFAKFLTKFSNWQLKKIFNYCLFSTWHTCMSNEALLWNHNYIGVCQSFFFFTILCFFQIVIESTYWFSCTVMYMFFFVFYIGKIMKICKNFPEIFQNFPIYQNFTLDLPVANFLRDRYQLWYIKS